MSKRPSVKTYLEKAILRQSAIGFLAMVLISVVVTFFLSRYKMDTDLQKSAIAAAEAFRSRILEGDIKAVESQIHDVLGLGESEQALILSPDFRRIYKSPHLENPPVPRCEPVGVTCFDSYIGPGKIFLPIYFDEKRENIFGYLYLSKSVQFDWIYVAIVFSIFAVGYVALLLGLANVTKGSLSKLAQDLEEWALRLKRNPKDRNPLSAAPFSELAPLKEAIEGLNTQIESYETRAGERAKTLILRGIAHDILSPVAQVQYYLATLEKKFAGNPSADDMLGEMKTSLAKVAMIATQVKCLNESAEPVEPIDLLEATKTEIESLQKSDEIRSKDITLKFLASGDQPVLAPMTRVEIGRVLQNLIQNAADASDPGSTVEIAISAQNGRSTLLVKDKGIGIPRHLHKKVFEPDFTSKPATGTGLGLFVVKHICEQRDGFVELESEPRQGTKITINIPSGSALGGVHAI